MGFGLYCCLSLCRKHQHGKICFSCPIERECGEGRTFVVLGISISLGCLHPFWICLSLNLRVLVRSSEFYLFATSPRPLLVWSLELVPSQNILSLAQKILGSVCVSWWLPFFENYGMKLYPFLCFTAAGMFTVLHHLLIYLFNVQYYILKWFFENSPWTAKFEKWMFIRILWIQQFRCVWKIVVDSWIDNLFFRFYYMTYLFSTD